MGGCNNLSLRQRNKCPTITLNKPLHIEQPKKAAFPWSFMLAGILIAVIIQGALRDGVTTWMPSLVMETFHLSSNISILTGVIFPVFSIVVFKIVSVIYNKSAQNELVLSGWLFAIGAVFALFTALFNGTSTVLTVAMSTVLIGAMHGVNLMLICMVPPHYAKFGRISLVSGMFNSFTYLGSAISTYGMASFTQRFGWNNTAFSWCCMALIGGVLCFSLSKKWSKF